MPVEMSRSVQPPRGHCLGESGRQEVSSGSWETQNNRGVSSVEGVCACVCVSQWKIANCPFMGKLALF